MNLFTGEASSELFGDGYLPASVRQLIDQAAGAPAEHREVLLWTARASAPECLAVYYLLYKFCASRREFESAEKAARAGLAEAARQARLDQDWTQVQVGAADFSRPGPARFWLFTLKALCFIQLRRGNSEASRDMLGHLRRLDPSDSVGGDVIEALLESAKG